jgi:hypothetical protein
MYFKAITFYRFLSIVPALNAVLIGEVARLFTMIETAFKLDGELA